MTNPQLKDKHTSRRNFLKKTASATAGLTASSLLFSSGCSNFTTTSSGRKSLRFSENTNVILFQGDSITDSGRSIKRQSNANDPWAMGNGYAFIAASQLSAKHYKVKPKVYNRGISADKVFQLADRWDEDCIALKPDIVSILIGINDYWHTFAREYDGTVETYEKDYRSLLERTRRELPETTLVICEPFVLRCGVVNDQWFPTFDGYRAAAKKVATEFKTIFVPFQSMFDKAIKKAPAEHWAADGVHPTIAGAYLMAQTWIQTVL